MKLHPDVMSGRRGGYFPSKSARAADADGRAGQSLVAARRGGRFTRYPRGWVSRRRWRASGSSPSARRSIRAGASPTIGGQRCSGAANPPLELFAAFYLRYTHYLDAYTRREIEFEKAAEQLAWLRDRFHEQTSRAVCYSIKRWKRTSIDRMLDGPAGATTHKLVRGGRAREGRAARSWPGHRATTLALEAACRARACRSRVEDGFIRSAGLGASFVPPSRWSSTPRHLLRPRAPSDLEVMLEEAEFPADLVERARRLRERLVSAGPPNTTSRPRRPRADRGGGRPVILVPGQVEDDASIERGSPELKRNVELLRRVRERHPDAFVVYKPHPDVEAGFRRGRVTRAGGSAYADRIVSRASILGLIGVRPRGDDHLPRRFRGAAARQARHHAWAALLCRLGTDRGSLPAAAANRASLDELVLPP